MNTRAIEVTAKGSLGKFLRYSSQEIVALYENNTSFYDLRGHKELSLILSFLAPIDQKIGIGGELAILGLPIIEEFKKSAEFDSRKIEDLLEGCFSISLATTIRNVYVENILSFSKTADDKNYKDNKSYLKKIQNDFLKLQALCDIFFKPDLIDPKFIKFSKTALAETSSVIFFICGLRELHQMNPTLENRGFSIFKELFPKRYKKLISLLMQDSLGYIGKPVEETELKVLFLKAEQRHLSAVKSGRKMKSNTEHFKKLASYIKHDILKNIGQSEVTGGLE